MNSVCLEKVRHVDGGMKWRKPKLGIGILKLYCIDNAMIKYIFPCKRQPEE